MHRPRARRRPRPALIAFAAWLLGWGLLAGWAYYLRWRRRQTRLASTILSALIADLTEQMQEAAEKRKDGPPSVEVWPTAPRPQQGEPPEPLH